MGGTVEIRQEYLSYIRCIWCICTHITHTQYKQFLEITYSIHNEEKDVYITIM